MESSLLHKKAVLLENSSQMRHCIKHCYECGIFHRKIKSQNLSFPCYMMIDHVKDDLYIAEVNTEGLDSEKSVEKLGYFSITLKQFREITKEIFKNEESI